MSALSSVAALPLVTDASPSNVVPFSKTARALRGRALMKAVDARMKRKPKAGLPVERLSKAECHARIRARIEAVGLVLNLSKDKIKPALSLKHEQVGIFATKYGLKLDWLIAGSGCAFRRRGELFELAVEYELRLKIEKSLRSESSRLDRLRWRLSCQKIGADPDNASDCDRARQANHEGWLNAFEDANRETGHSVAWTKWNTALNRRVKVGKQILKFGAAMSGLGLMIRMRVLATIDEETIDENMSARMVAELRAFFLKRGDLNAGNIC